MATGPGDQLAAAAAARGRLRASHADREQVIGILKAAFVQGMLAKDEFDLRVGQTFASRTYAELAVVTADLPAGLTAQPPEPARARGEQPVLPPGPVIAVATVLYAVVWPLAILLPEGSDGQPQGSILWLFTGTVVYVLVLIAAAGRIRALRREEGSGRQPPQRPAAGAGGQASRRLPSAGLGG